MTDRPILMSAPMVRALLDGRKCQTRRPAWREQVDPADNMLTIKVATIWQKVKPGDRLWVRETWKFVGTDMARLGRTHDRQDGVVDYRADDERRTITTHWVNVERLMITQREHCQKWRPSIHMPRWASRMTLLVTETRMQRLQEISSAGAIAEGCRPRANSQTIDCDTPNPRNDFARLWESLHGDDAWQANPEVVALTFTVHQRNIDSMESAA